MDPVMFEKAPSPDGTPIAFYRTGSGPPLVLVAGTGAANPLAWTGVIPELEKHFTVIAVDRRGRGMSGDNPSYAIEREYEDNAAVVDTLKEPAHLLGHSFGALLAMEAALHIPKLRKLILYEPWIPRPGIPLYPERTIERLEAQLAAGNREEVLTTHYREDAGLTPGEIEQMKSSPAWAERLASAHTLPRELHAEEQYRFAAQRFKDFHTPTLLLLGGESSPVFRESTEIVDKALPNSRIAVLPGQQHIAMYTAPELFLNKVISFLAGPD